ncbi:MAG: methyltransferase domain-containing protein [Pirellulales bacterium]
MTQARTAYFDPASLSDGERDHYQGLLRRIEADIPVEHSTVEIAGYDYPWLKVIDPDQLLENALSRTDRSPEELDPFWAATWRAAIGLDRYLARQPIQGQRVLELGCGSGRAGIAAALHGAVVTMTDAAVEGMWVAEYNAFPVRQATRIKRLHWGDETLDEDPFSWIIGSDIVYDPKLWSILEPCIRRHLAPGGKVLLTEPQRQTGDRFLNWIRDKQWHVAITIVDLEDQQREIRVFELTL